MAASTPLIPVPSRGRELLIAILLMLWLVGGLGFLIQSDPPVGRLVVTLTAQETGAVIPEATLQLSQGDRFWEYTADEKGQIKTSLPIGTFKAVAYSPAHRLEKAAPLTLQEGETAQLTLALPPVAPFLELIHPQPVYLPGEEIKIGVRGFVKPDQLQIDIDRVVLPVQANNLGTVLDTLESVRNGWWEGAVELQQQLRAMQNVLNRTQQRVIPVTGRDREGVFMQYATLQGLPEGTYLVRFRAGGLENSTLVIRTQTGLVVKSTDRGRLLVWTSGLKSGKPQVGNRIEAWSENQTQPLATGTTDQNGISTLTLPPRPEDGYVFVISYQGQSRQPVAWVKQYLPGTPPVQWAGLISSDRPVYRPSNVVQFKGVLRRPAKVGYTLPPTGTGVTVLIQDPDNTLIARRQVQTNRFGSFAGTVTLTEEAKAGSYRISAQTATGKLEGNFTVAAYRKPTFKVSLKSAKPFFTANEIARLELESRYYFGLPVGNAPVQYQVYRVPLFSWSDQPEDDEEVSDYGEAYGDYYGEYVTSGTTETNAEGKAQITLDPKQIPETEQNNYLWSTNNYRYRVAVTIEAAGNEYAEGTLSFPITQGNWRMALEPDPWFGAPKTAFRIRATINDRTGNQPQKATVQWRAGIYQWQGEQPAIQWQNEATGTATTDAQGQVQWDFTPPKGGDWLLEATIQDAQGNRITEQVMLWVTDRAVGNISQPRGPALQLLTDQRSYEVGDRVKLALRSSLPAATVLVTVEGEEIFSTKLVTLKQGQGSLELPVEARLVPSVYISASLIANKTFTEQSIPLRIGRAAKELKIQIQSNKPRYEPGEQAQISVQVQTHQGKPVQTELSLGVVDEALYAIREDQPKALFNSLYARRPNRVTTQFSFPWIAVQGDKGEADSVRRNFPDTALWRPQLITDAQGQATVRLNVPDNLTQWRVTAIGQTLDTQVGSAVYTFTAAKEFAVRLAAPTVLTEGDQVTLSAVVSNEGTRSRKATVDFLGAGKTLYSSALTVDPGQSQTVSWRYKADQIGTMPLRVRAVSQDGKRDSEERLIQVLPYASTERMVRWASVQKGITELDLPAPEGLIPQESQIQVRLAPSVFSQLLGALDYLVDYPYGCTEQTMSRFLPSLAVYRLVEDQKLDLPYLQARTPEILQRSLARLYRFQNYDGGWGWWEEDQNDLYMTAHVLRGLAVARQAGMAINEEKFAQGRESLATQIKEQWAQGFKSSQFTYYRRYIAEDYTFALYALALSGAPIPTDDQGRFLVPKASELSPYGRALLALAWTEWERPEQARQILEQLDQVQQQDETGAYWTMPKAKEEYFYNWINPAETTAWVLLAQLRYDQAYQGSLPPVEKVDPIVRWLLAQRQAEGWGSTKDTAVVLEALLAYSQGYEAEAVTTTLKLQLNDQPVREVRLTPQARWQPETVITLDQPRPGTNQLRIERDGPGIVYATVLFNQKNRLEATVPPTGALKLERVYLLQSPGRGQKGEPTIEERALKPGEAVASGSQVRVRVRVTGWNKNNDASHLILEDPLPAGFRATDMALSQDRYSAGSYYTTEARDDRMIGYFHWISGTTLEFEYLLRAEVPGIYRVLPSQLWAMYGNLKVSGLPAQLEIQ